MADCLNALGSDDFAAALVAGLRRLVPVEDSTVLYYSPGGLPRVVYREDPDSRGKGTIERFVQGAFLLDPFYQSASRDHRFGLFRLDELAPARFRESEYYRSWYRNCGFSDECGYLVELRQGAFVNIALGRVGRRRFSEAQVATLRALRPAVERLCQHHWIEEQNGEHELKRQLNQALDEFGSSLLTEREAQSVNLILHGHSTKSIAARLGISVETVKLHRKHAYAKLEVGSQAELFYLFIDSVMSAGDYRGGDTLINYLSKRSVDSEESQRHSLEADARG